MDIISDIRTLTEFKRDATRFISHLKDTGRPSVLTVNGKPALVVMDAEALRDTSGSARVRQNRRRHSSGSGAST